MGYVWTGGKNGNKLLSCRSKTNTCWWGLEEKEESIVLLLTFKALKWNVFTITLYKDVIFMHRFCQSATNIDTNQYQHNSTNCYWTSIPINNHTNLPHQLVLKASQFKRYWAQVTQARNMSIGEHWHCCVTFKI